MRDIAWRTEVLVRDSAPDSPIPCTRKISAIGLSSFKIVTSVYHLYILVLPRLYGCAGCAHHVPSLKTPILNLPPYFPDKNGLCPVWQPLPTPKNPLGPDFVIWFGQFRFAEKSTCFQTYRVSFWKDYRYLMGTLVGFWVPGAGIWRNHASGPLGLYILGVHPIFG